MRNQVSVVIPTLNSAAHLSACLASVAGVSEIVVVDGGSADATVPLAGALGARVLHVQASRGGQLRAGVAATSAPYVLLLHADTVLGPSWANTLPVAQAGYFGLRFASHHLCARMLERVVALRCRWLSLPYGDQGLLLNVDLLREAGGVPDLPLMEDVALVRRLGRNRLVQLTEVAITSAARYERDGFLRRPLRNTLCLGLYFAGISPRIIKKFYG